MNMDPSMLTCPPLLLSTKNEMLNAMLRTVESHMAERFNISGIVKSQPFYEFCLATAELQRVMLPFACSHLCLMLKNASFIPRACATL